MVASNSAQDQIASLMADVMPEQVLHFKFSPTIQARIVKLVDQKKASILTFEEADELDKYLMYDLLIGLAKARAYQHIH
jgi:hypothetical protein